MEFVPDDPEWIIEDKKEKNELLFIFVGVYECLTEYASGKTTGKGEGAVATHRKIQYAP